MLDIRQINVLAELERCGVAYDWAGEEHVRIRCPFHEATGEHSPSCYVNVEKRMFDCKAAGCRKDGDFITLLARAMSTTREVIIVDLSKRYLLESDKIVDPELIERYHEALWGAGVLLRELRKRGVTDAIIRHRRYGEHKGRITIPVRNEAGHFVNIRKYLPGAPGPEKMKNLPGRGEVRLYPIEQLKYPRILVCGGELKADVAAEQLNPHGIGAICATAGEGNWDSKFTDRLIGKEWLGVCFDIDEAGQVAAQGVLAQLSRTRVPPHNIVLPLDIDKYPHGDINDFIGQEHGDLMPLLTAAEPWKPTRKEKLPLTEPSDTALAAAVDAANVGKRMAIKVSVAAVDSVPYTVPARVEVKCDRQQRGCASCPVFVEADLVPQLSIEPEADALVEMVSAPRGVQHEAIMRALDIPMDCKTCSFNPVSYYSIEDVRISPQFDVASRVYARTMQPALCIGSGVELNESYVMTGRLWPHPQTQQSTLLISGYETSQDALSTYRCTNLDRLQLFQPSEWTVDAIDNKLHDLYADLEANVTRIYQRRDLHLIADLAYHSPLLLKFDGRPIKGWAEVLIVGDSSQGKSETVAGLMRHYGLGELVECKNATVAGLLGGLQQIGKRWFVSWGVIPTHDKRLVVLEELKGASQEVIAKLTDMRSRGIAEIPKIERRKTHARTRIIAISNPRGDRPMSAHNFGVEAIRELIGNLEDVRRFDMALVVTTSQLDASALNVLTRHRPVVQHMHHADLCRSLVLWSWTRTEHQVRFEPEATDLALEEATELSEQFTDAIPLVDRGSMRHKLARLSAALACRTFSCSPDMEEAVVRPCHVAYIAGTLRRVYADPTFGYSDYTEAIKLSTTMVDADVVMAQLRALPFPKDFARSMLNTAAVQLTDIQDWCGWNRGEAMGLLSLLVRKRALTRERDSYRKTADFIQLLRHALESGQALQDRPDFMKGQF